MPDALTEYLERFIFVGENAFRLIFDREDTKDEIIRLNTEVQLGELGVKSDGNLVSPDGYADFTVRERLIEGLQVSHMDLNFTGEFWRSFTVTVGADFFVIDAQDDKGDRQLFDVYGENVAGLTNESFEEFLPFVQDVVREILEGIKK